jgi:hypothetical protein
VYASVSYYGYGIYDYLFSWGYLGVIYVYASVSYYGYGIYDYLFYTNKLYI